MAQRQLLPPVQHTPCHPDSLVFTTNQGVIDFNRWNYYQRPSQENYAEATFARREGLVTDIYHAINQLSHQVSSHTIQYLASQGCRQLFIFLDDQCANGINIVKIEQFTLGVINDYLLFLKNKPAKTITGKYAIASQRLHYNSVKAILMTFTKQGRITNSIFPNSPFTNVNRASSGALAYSKSEFSRVMRFLWGQIKRIREGSYTGSYRNILAIYILLIAAKTGRNTSTILSLKTDCISPHPLAPETHILLTGYKKRGMNTSVQAMKGSYTAEDIFSTHKDIGSLIDEVIQVTEPARSRSGSQALFLVSDKVGKISVLTDMKFWRSVQSLPGVQALVQDNGQKLSIHIKRMRKTFATRMWQLSGGDPLKTAKLMGNSIPVMNKHYLAVTPEMQRDHKYFGVILTNTLLGQTEEANSVTISKLLNIDVKQASELLIGQFNTLVGRCADPFDGGSKEQGDRHCTRFTQCFQCPNQVILASDLHRLYSFYWLLKNERAFIGHQQWKKRYCWVINVIETDIEPAFDKKVVASAKKAALDAPSPMWSSRSALEALWV